jgi:hypothetical protein
MPITLDPLLTEYRGVVFSPDSYYRFHGDAGLSDFRDKGLIRNDPNGKYADRGAYFSKGAGSGQYSKRGGNVLVEAHPRFHEGPSKHGGYVTKDAAKTDRIRIYTSPSAGTPYRVAYDNYSPHKYYGRKGLAAVSKLGPVAGLAAPLIDDYDPGVYEARFGYKPESLPATVGLAALGYASDVGDVATVGLAGRYLYQDGPQANPVDDASAVYNAIRKYVGDLFK